MGRLVLLSVVVIALAVVAASVQTRKSAAPRMNFFSTVDMVAVKADVLVADHDLIRRDFACLRHASNADIERWLLDETAFMRRSQIERNPASGRLRSAPGREGHLPPMYGRAAVLALRWPENDACASASPKYLDVKGTGTNRPMPLLHATGTAETSKSLHEFYLAQWLSHAARFEPVLQPISHYAVLRLHGCVEPNTVDYQSANGSWVSVPSSCGVLVREYSPRPEAYVINYDQQMRIQLAMHRFGLSALVPAAAQRYAAVVPFDRLLTSPLALDLQGTRDGRLIDLNTVTVHTPGSQLFNWSPKRGPPISVVVLADCFDLAGHAFKLPYDDCLLLLRGRSDWNSQLSATVHKFAKFPPQVNPLGVRAVHPVPIDLLRNSWWSLCDDAERCQADITRLLVTDSSGHDFSVFQELLAALQRALHRHFPITSE